MSEQLIEYQLDGETLKGKGCEVCCRDLDTRRESLRTRLLSIKAQGHAESYDTCRFAVADVCHVRVTRVLNYET